MRSIESIERLIDRYCEAWSEFDPRRREEMLREIWADGATYVDPRGEAAGIAELTALIGRVLEKRPGARVVRTSAVDAHHGLARFAWRVVQADGSALPESMDMVEVSSEGRLQRVIGFFGPLAGK